MADSGVGADVDFEPPAACINRLIKAALPETVQVTKEARQAFAKAAGIFVIYLTTCANEFCKDKKRQTVSAADVLAAVTELDLEESIPDFKEQLQTFLASFRSNEGSKRKPASRADDAPPAKKSRGGAAAARAAEAAEDDAPAAAGDDDDADDDDDAPGAAAAADRGGGDDGADDDEEGDDDDGDDDEA